MSIRKFLSGLFFRFSSWELVVEEELPTNGGVLVGAPHTSNWDFIAMLAIAGQTGLKFKWLGKDSLFRGPAGPFMRALGGIPVDRRNPHGLVEDMAQRFAAEPGFVLAITPKGTRSKADYWKSGFYRIAKEADVPLLLAFVDSATGTTGIGPVIHLTDDVSADMDKVRAFYGDKVGIKPESTSIPRLRSEDKAVDPVEPAGH